MHAIWTLPPNDADFSMRWRLIKSGFTRHLNDTHFAKLTKKPKIWQPYFWEHLIRDAQDFENHMNYVHYNPVKHGLVKRVIDWQHSTFHRFVKEGIYTENWGCTEMRFPNNGQALA